ncbi:MAG: PKD domain-containing protein [Chitinophagales bacterium]|nr:PKD domain-containing protein [Chitinophagales bacterium]
MKGVLFFLTFLIINSIYAQVDFSLSVQEGCTPLNVGVEVKNIQADSTIWNFGNGTTKKGNKTFVVYNEGGIFNIKMTAYKDGVPTIITKNVKVNKSPVADFQFDKNQGCPPLEVNFQDKSIMGSGSIVKRTWGLGNGKVLDGNIANHTTTFNTSGIREISLIVEDQSGCKSNKVVSSAIEVFPIPKVAFDFNNSTQCNLPVEVSFTNQSDSLTSYKFNWNFGDGKSSTDVNPKHSYTKEGTYTMSLKATDFRGCTSEVSKSNMIVDENFSVKIGLSDTLGCDSLGAIFSPNISSLYRSLKWTIDPKLNPDMKKMTISTKEIGVFQIKLEATSQFGCTISSTRNVYVGRKPIADFKTNDTLGCKVPFQVSFQNLSKYADSYLWNFGSGAGNSNIQDPIYTYNKPAIYLVSLTSKGDYGCSSTKTKFSYISIVSPQAEMISTNDNGCSPLKSNFQVNSLNGFTVSSIKWDFGNGNTYNGVTPPQQTFNSEGNYVVTAKVSFKEGCDELTLKKTISVGSKVSNINGGISSNSICPNQNLTGQVDAIAGAEYEWKIGNDTIYKSRTFKHKFSSSGTFNISLNITKSGCVSTINYGNVTVKPTAANFVVTNKCSGTEVTFRNNDNNTVESTWNFGSGDIRNDNKTVTHDFQSFGTKSVTLKVYNKTTGCKDEITKAITINKSELDNYNIAPIQGCAPLTFELNSPAISSNTYWMIGDSLIVKNIKKGQFVIDSAGIYDLSLRIVYDGCRYTRVYDNLIKVIKPEAGFKFNPLGGCSPISVTFEDTSKSLLSNIVKYRWAIKDSSIGVTDSKFTRTFNEYAILPIQHIVTDDFGCSDTVTNDLIVARPFAEFEVPSKSFCTGNAFKPTNFSTGVGLLYEWNFGDGTPIDTSRFPQHNYKNEGTYDIHLKITDANNCISEKLMSNAVTIQDFDYDFTASPTFKYCPELIVEFQVIPGDIEYRQTLWDFGDGVIVSDTNKSPRNIYNKAGEYDVSLILEDFRGCGDTIVKKKLVQIEGPEGSFKSSIKSSCAPTEVVFSANTKNSKASFWDFGDGEGFFEDNEDFEIKHVYEKPGIYIPSVTVDDGLGCVVTVIGDEIKIGGPNAKTVLSPGIVCSDQNLVFSDSSVFTENIPYKNRTWSFSDGFTSKDSTFTRTFKTDDSTNIYITLTVEDSIGCIGVAYDTARVFAYAPLRVKDSLLICKGDTIQLKASRVHYAEWGQSGSLSQTDILNPLAFPLQNTLYKVRGFVSPTCYTDKTVFVRVLDAFSGTALNDTSVCIGDMAHLWVKHDNINSGKFDYEWTLNGTLIGSSKDFDVLPNQTSTYIIRIKNGACKDFVAPTTVRVKNYPSLSIDTPEPIVKGQEVRIQANSDPGVNYTWTPQPDVGCKNCPFGYFRPQSTTEYTVTVEKEGCAVSESVTVDVSAVCNSDLVKIPNVFTPNSDGLNDVFSIENNDKIRLNSLKIFSRTGELVYESANMRDKWDGTYNGKPLNTGVYVYYLDAECVNGTPILLTGNITLLR